ncbi:hypothetical protein Btru_046678 [Bulinus truncatus]|nr:hypothetical protein Btru_046678 [Bulinus truncatus]
MLSMSSQCRRVLNSPVHYLQMILKVAQMVQKVHQKHFVLGELKASTLFVDSTDDDIKVYPISLAQLNFSCDSSSDVAFEVSVNRSNFKDAGNIHSSVENDIHSLGNLMMEVFIKVDSLDDLQTDYDVIDAKRTSLCRPKSCPESIYQIMKKCFSAQPQERPKLQEIIRVINLELESVKKVSSELGNLIPKTSGCSPSFDPGCISKVMNPSESSSSSSSSSHSLDRTKKHVHIQKRKKIFKKLNPINSKCSTEIETMQKHLKYRPQHSIYSQNPMAERQLTPLPKNNFFTSICVESVSEKGHSINISKINTKDDTFIPSLNLEVSPTDNRQQHSYDNANDRIESDDNLTYVLIKSHSCSKHFINQPSPDHDLLDGSLIKTESHYLDTSNDLIHNDYKAIYI